MKPWLRLTLALTASAGVSACGHQADVPSPEGFAVDQAQTLEATAAHQRESDTSHDERDQGVPFVPLVGDTLQSLNPSGLAWVRLRAGQGRVSPASDDAVRIRYTAWTNDRRFVAGSSADGRPSSYVVSRLVPGLSEALASMVVGEQRRLWVPVELAYAGRPGFPPGDLIYDLELVEILDTPARLASAAHIPSDARESRDGLAYTFVSRGSGGARPTLIDEVRVSFTAWDEDDELVDSTDLRGRPLTIPLAQAITGWQKALPLMAVGDRALFWLPERLTYQGSPGAPQGTLLFDIQLLEVISAMEPPIELEPSGGEARVSASGISSKLIAPGHGDRSPGPESLVTLHYAGWTADGESLDSSYARGQPRSLRLSSLIPAWQEALLTMVVGERRRLWVPPAQSNTARPELASGALVYDIELLAISD